MGSKTSKEIIASSRQTLYHTYVHGEYLQELCVYGYIRNHCNIDIPDVLKQLCLAMYLITIDKWSKQLSHASFQIDQENGHICPSISGGGWKHAFGSFLIKKGEIMTWSIKITNESIERLDNRAVMYGISNISENDGWNKQSYGYHFCDLSFTGAGYGYDAWTGNTQTSLTVQRNNYGPSWDKDDIITMTLDMSGQKYGVLSYAINGKNLGVAFDQIDIDDKYRMTACIYYYDKLQLVPNPYEL